MARLLYRLGTTAYRRWPLFLIGWLIVLVGVGALAAGFARPMSQQFTMPGIPSMRAAQMQQELFPGAQRVDAPTVSVVVGAPDGASLADAPHAAAVDRLVRRLRALPTVPDQVQGPVDVAAAMGQAAEAQVDQAQRAAEAAGETFD
ncbi:MAG TPA: MMPL family transporter, partial [Miltoncostaeaceae bacterium]|nr:MMPL family transporter [Miltoncostaeaceae bacterium]